jgi:hypothetical protein
VSSASGSFEDFMAGFIEKHPNMPHDKTRHDREEKKVTQQRKHLDDYSRALRDIEHTGIAITIIERVSLSRSASAAIGFLKREQRRNIRRLDRAAEKLGAPYPG